MMLCCWRNGHHIPIIRRRTCEKRRAQRLDSCRQFPTSVVAAVTDPMPTNILAAGRGVPQRRADVTSRTRARQRKSMRCAAAARDPSKRQGLPGNAQDDLRSLASRLEDLEQVRFQATKLRDRMLSSAGAALARGDEEEARRALGRKIQATDILRDAEAKMTALRGEEVRLRDYKVISELRAAIEEDDQRLLHGSETSTPEAADMELSAFLPALSVELGNLRAAKEVKGALGAMELVPALLRMSKEQQKQLAKHEAAALETLLSSVASGDGISSPVELQQRGGRSPLLAAQLLEAAYQGRAMVEFFCAEKSREALLGPMEVLKFRGSSEVDQPAYCILLEKDAKVLHVTVRGLDSLKDVLTAARANPAKLLDGLCHQGAMLSSRWLIEQIRPHCAAHRPRELRLYGHSLGGAVAAAAAVQLATWSLPGREKQGAAVLPEGCGVTAVTFGPPPCFQYGPELRRAADSHVRTYVNGTDCVCWLGQTNITAVFRLARGLSRGANPPPLPLKSAAAAARSSERPQSFGSWIGKDSTQQMLLPGTVAFLDGVQGLYSIVPTEPEAFVGTIPLTDRCITDHRLYSYVKALTAALGM